MKSTLLKKKLLNYLFQNKSATRKQMAQSLKIRPGTVGVVCGQLMRDGCVKAVNANNQRNVMLKIAPEKYQALGVEHVAGGIMAVIMAADLTVQMQERINIPEKIDGLERLKRITDGLNRLIQKARCSSALVGLGFCDVGMFDASTGRSIRSALLPDWNDMPLREELGKKLKVPVFLPGKMDSWCVAEHKFGAAGKWDTFICVMLDRVIGLSVMNSGKIIQGNNPVYGELGHMVCDPAGDICKCGGRGCLETIAGTDAIVKKAAAHMTPADELIFAAAADKLTIEHVIQAARNGHKLAETALIEAGAAAGLALARVLTVLGINNVVVAGRLVAQSELFLEQLKRSLRQYCVHPLNTQLEIVTSSLDEWSSARGAAYSVLENYFDGKAVEEKNS